MLRFCKVRKREENIFLSVDINVCRINRKTLLCGGVVQLLFLFLRMKQKGFYTNFQNE